MLIRKCRHRLCTLWNIRGVSTYVDTHFCVDRSRGGRPFTTRRRRSRLEFELRAEDVVAQVSLKSQLHCHNVC